MKKEWFLSLVTSLIICSAGLLTAQQICSNQTGYASNGYHYELWKDRTDAAVCMTVKDVDAQFDVQWTNVGDFLALVGLKYDGTQTPFQIGTFSATYACTYNPNGNSYLGVHGWMVDTSNPYIEFYIVDSWGTWQPPGLTVKGTVIIDGAQYDIYKTVISRPDAVAVAASIVGLDQYWSVRKTKRTSGTISISEHFAQWERLGMPLRKLNDVNLFIEGYQSSGIADFTLAKVVVDNTLIPTPTPVVKLGDVNGDGVINIADALLVAQYSSGIPVGTTFIAANADVSKDGLISIIDALEIAQYSAGLRTGF